MCSTKFIAVPEIGHPVLYGLNYTGPVHTPVLLSFENLFAKNIAIVYALASTLIWMANSAVVAVLYTGISWKLKQRRRAMKECVSGSKIHFNFLRVCRYCY